jgi:gliding motility-associated lipoprotein GldH
LKLKYSAWCLTTAFVFWLGACKKIDVYEKNAFIAGFRWEKSFKPNFQFENTDSQARYRFYAVIRHTNKYPYSNLWLRVGVQAPGDSLQTQDVELQLTRDNKEWAGAGMDDIFELRAPLRLDKIKFTRPTGQYRFTLEQIMRDNPLPQIMNIGLRIEKLPQP